MNRLRTLGLIKVTAEHHLIVKENELHPPRGRLASIRLAADLCFREVYENMKPTAVGCGRRVACTGMRVRSVVTRPPAERGNRRGGSSRLGLALSLLDVAVARRTF